MIPVKILIADDHEMVRQGLRRVLDNHPQWAICAEATSGREAVTLAGEHHPELIIMDFSMPGLNGLDAAIEIRRSRPATKVILLTMHESDTLVHDALAAGVHGFLLKTDAGRLLVQAVEALLEGRPFFTAKVSQRLVNGYLSVDRGASPAGAARFTSREREVIQLIAEGLSSKEVAQSLGISVKTIETHRTKILQKLGAHSVTEIVRYAIRNGLISA